MKVRVYWNRHRKNWSVLKKEEKGWRVWKRSNKLTLYDCSFIVRENGRQRCLLSNKRNVHAFCEGDNTKGDKLFIKSYCKKIRVKYNPYKNSMFMANDYPIIFGYIVDFVGKNCYAWV